MADYKLDTFNTRGTMPEVLAAMEVQLETLDSTTNVIRDIGIIPMGVQVQGYIIYEIA